MSIQSVEQIEKIKNEKKVVILNPDQLYKNIESCESCELKNILEVNKNIVKSSGRYNAPIMIIGKNPSYKRRGDSCFGEQDSVNNPHLNKLLNRHKLSMQDVYSTNLVKCSTENNDDPNNQCLESCKQYLEQEIEYINPKIIICCGKFVSNYFDLNFGEKKTIDDKIYVSIKHPSSLSYNNSEEEKQKYYLQLDIIKKDLKKIKNKMFVQLHFHDEYSIRDALGKIEDYRSFIKDNHLPAFSTTNHGNIGGFIRQYIECNKQKIKPIFGCELYINNHRKDNKEEVSKEDKKNNHLCVYAKNLDGFNNLSKITSDAWINGFYYKPRTDIEFLKKYSKGIIASSACLAGELPRMLENNDYESAKKFIEQYKQTFEDFYIELMIIDMQEQKNMNSKLAKIAKETNTKTIITCDTHYMKAEYSKVHDTMLLIRDGYTLNDLNDPVKREKIFQYKVKDLYYKNTDDIFEDFKNGHKSEFFTEEIFWDSIDNVFNFTNDIEFIKLDTTSKLPKLGEDSEQLLKQKIDEGLKNRNLQDNKIYIDRAEYEYSVIIKMGYTDYFLIMWDIMYWAKNNNIICGCGRGSSAGSLVAYLLRITEIDPIKYGLLFERFISIGRFDMPDVDSDYDPRDRDNIKDYIIQRFGQDNVCTIGTYGTYKSRGTLLDVARVHDIPLFETLQLTKNVMTSDCDFMTFDEIRKDFPAVDVYFKNYPEIEQACNVIRGQIRNISKHAAGVVISDRNLSENIPLMQTDGNIFSAWAEGGDYHELSMLGFIKFDILGLNNLSVIKDCISLIKERHNINLDFYNWQDMNNEKALKLANEADTAGIFQFESRISREILKNVGIDCFMDLSHISALLRPGPLRAGVPDLFAKRKRGEEKFDAPEILKDILGETHYVICYQEQVMLIAQKIADFSLVESNDFRKALVKYGRGDAVESQRIEKAFSYKDKFLSNAVKHISKEYAEDMWEKMVSFVNYAFNRSHSVSYAHISYVEFYLKANYFVEFMTALLNNTDRGKEDNQKDSVLKNYINYAKEKGLKVLNPDINLSQQKFSILDENTIIFGLEHIKNMSNGSEDVINNRPYKNFEDFCFKVTGKKIKEELKDDDAAQFFKKIKSKHTVTEVVKTKLNKSKIESMIYAGCFNKYSEEENNHESENFKRNDMIRIYNTTINKKKDYKHVDLDRRQLIEKEIEMLKMCLSDTIFPESIQKEYDSKSAVFKRPSALKEYEKGNVIGQLDKILACKTKSGKNIGSKYYKLSIIDDTDQINITCFGAENVAYIDANLKQGQFIIISEIKYDKEFQMWGCKSALKNNVKILT